MNKCPICSKLIAANLLFFCSTCWWKLNAKDRVALGNMHKRKQRVVEKVESITQKFKAT